MQQGFIRNMFCASALIGLAAVAQGEIAWTIPDRYVTLTGKRLVVDVPADAKDAHMAAARATLDVSRYAGKRFEATIRARAAWLTRPPQPWLGFKFMLNFVDDEGVTQWLQAPVMRTLEGGFGWQTFKVSYQFPDGGVRGGKATLIAGIQEITGRAEFDLASLTIGESEPLAPIVNREMTCVYTDRVRNAPQRRGVMSPGRPMTEDDFHTLQDWGATLLRYQIVGNFSGVGQDTDLAKYDAWLNGKLDHLEQLILPQALKRNIQVVIDVHNPPGGRLPNQDWRMYYEPKYAQHLVDCWKRIATRFKGHPAVYGYDIDNEPVQTSRAAPGCDYWTLQCRAARAIREIDTETPIIIESNDWDGPDAFAQLSPVDLTNVIYQVHMYRPSEFTHQGVHRTELPKDAPSYPDAAKKIDAQALRWHLRKTRAFEQRFKAKIYVGEFSAITWAKGADRYIADCIDIFREYGWDWTYHAFREWSGWSVEHEAVRVGADPSCFRPSADNPRKRALLKGLRAQ